MFGKKHTLQNKNKTKDAPKKDNKVSTNEKRVYKVVNEPMRGHVTEGFGDRR